MDKKVRLNYKSITTILTVVLVMVVIVNFYTLYTIQQLLNVKLLVAQEAAKPILLEALLITNTQCTNCFDVKPILDEIETIKGIELKAKSTMEYNVPAAKETITKYGLERFPSLVITGDIARATVLKNKLPELGGVEKENAFVFAKPQPPYTDTEGKIRGRVSVILLKDDGCNECTDAAPLITQLKMLGVAVAKEETLSSKSKEGQEAIATYKLTRLPTLVFSSDFGAYEELAGSWKLYGDIASDGSYLFKEITPPYKDIATGAVKGLVTMTYLTDASCNECYNVSVHKQVLGNFGISITGEKQYDYASLEGKALVTKYNVTALPTILLSSEAKEYKALMNVWERVGSVEQDGVFVFRKIDAMGEVTYKNLLNNTVVKVSNE